MSTKRDYDTQTAASSQTADRHIIQDAAKTQGAAKTQDTVKTRKKIAEDMKKPRNHTRARTVVMYAWFLMPQQQQQCDRLLVV